MRWIVLSMVLMSAAACGGSSPAAPSAANLAIESFTTTWSGTIGARTYTLRFRVRETTGRAAATITRSGFRLNSSSGVNSFLLGGLPVRVGAGSVFDPGAVQVFEQAPIDPSRQMMIQLIYTDDTGESRVASATADVTPQ